MDENSAIRHDDDDDDDDEWAFMGDIQVCVTEEDDIEGFLMAGIVKQEPAEEQGESGVGNADVPYGDIDIYEPNIKTECEKSMNETNSDPVASFSSFTEAIMANNEQGSNGQIHTVDKLFKCNICSKKYNQMDYLNHRKNYCGKNSFQCNVCMKTFRNRHDLNAHKRFHDIPLECSICTEKFSHMSHLLEHNKQHRGEKRFECDICSKKFREWRRLKRHKQIHILQNQQKPFERNSSTKKIGQMVIAAGNVFQDEFTKFLLRNC